jgi:DNA mismatch repair ATPase MutS
VAEFLDWPPTKAKSLEASLRFIGDLPRLHRKCQLGTLTNQDFVTLGQSYASIQDLWPLFQDFFKSPTGLQEAFELYRDLWSQHIDGNKALNASEDVTVFLGKTYPEIGTVETEIGTVLGQFELLRASLCSDSSLSPDAIRLEGREKEPFGLKASTNVLKALQATKNKGLVIQTLKSGGWIDCPELETLNRRLVKLREQLSVLSRDATLKATSAISSVGAPSVWSSLEEWISHVDCTRCIARTARERGFHKPIVEDVLPSNTSTNTTNDSYLDLEGLRHPLVESTGTRVAYVQHSVKLDQDTNSWLVYGMNASGKSTLMKATGIAILLAQAGSYVPALRLRFRPFRSIYTRILNHDNLFAGLSSFAVEMSELRDILRQANEYSLVLGDEMCSGTESLSAMSLVAAGIEWLSAKRAKFIFATHLHDLPSILDCAVLKLKVWHLRVEYDPVSQKLIYDRTLMPGSGSSLYGLEVAKAMDLPLEFLEKARTHRKALMKFDGGTSSWNSAIKRNLCEICGNPVALEVHHIQERHTAKNGLLPDGTPMNAVANLVVLCATCHDKEHVEAIVQPIVQTSEGPVRLSPVATTATTATTVTTKSSTKSKWSEEERTAIETVLKEYKKASSEALSCKLWCEYQIKISGRSLTAIRKTLY